jgi:cell division protein FtsZ
VLLSIAGGSDLGLFEINEAAALVSQAAHPDANIIFGATIDDALGDEVRVTVIAAGFDGGMPKRREEGGSVLRRGANAAPPQQTQAQTKAAAAELAKEKSPALVGAPAGEAGGSSDTPSASPGVTKARVPEQSFADDELDVPDFLK